ncbi:MoxR family ATPase [Amycolatopsis sp. WQ 127309]|uniref:AAA family ATPase n=1 Tax=Amycolatopsis sp. WQ 127309 TaxID=2932773 RepID=UPI001FF50F88|nr:AAA family ATPase [Amycolatopsis sp. WQ 127309]UOZ07550.1 AAA family ATPase [Amycolatopsis sp. WQ 127309]
MSEAGRPETPPGWWVYRGTGLPAPERAGLLPPPPPWREFDGGPLLDEVSVPSDNGEMKRRLGAASTESVPRADIHEVDMVNAALYLRRPLLVTGRPGSGKSSLAFRIARELGLGRVLQWPITSHTTVKAGQYGYDAIGRAQAAGARSAGGGEAEPPIGDFVRLGELGTAFLPRRRPRVLLIDELDKSEADLPNDLLSLFEDGEFEIPELIRMAQRTPVVEVFTADPDSTAEIIGGRVRCHAFPVVIITSNGERDFPPAFLRRCLRYETKDPDVGQLAAMVAAHMLDPSDEHRSRIIEEFVSRSEAFGGLPVDKLLEAVYLATSGAYREDDVSWPRLVDALWRQLNSLVS